MLNCFDLVAAFLAVIDLSPMYSLGIQVQSMDLVLFSKVAFCDCTVNLTAEFRRRLEIVKLRCNSR